MKRPKNCIFLCTIVILIISRIDLPLDVLLGKTPKMTRDVQTLKAKGDALVLKGSPLQTR
ncbi:hypothetical protein ACLK17_15640 [Escherichia coli]